MKKHVVFNVSDPPFLIVISKYYNDIYYISILIYIGSWFEIDVIFIDQISFHYIPVLKFVYIARNECQGYSELC